MPFKNFRLNRIQNRRLSAIIYFHMPNILQTVFLTNLYRIQNDRKSAISYLDWPDIG